MSPVVLDCIGLPCPQPVLRAKDALTQGAARVEILVDNEASKNNLLRFARSQGHTATSADRPGGCFTVFITATAEPVAGPIDPEILRCDVPASPVIVCVIGSETMGRGNEELGWALLQTYVQTIKDVSPLPEKILLYNGGVKLVATESGALDALRDLQSRGVDILACGTCLDFYQLKSALQVGQITNMYEIMNTMTCADKIVSPF